MAVPATQLLARHRNDVQRASRLKPKGNGSARSVAREESGTERFTPKHAPRKRCRDIFAIKNALNAIAAVGSERLVEMSHGVLKQPQALGVIRAGLLIAAPARVLRVVDEPLGMGHQAENTA